MGFLKQSVLSVGVKGLSIVLGFVVVVLLARVLGPAEYGIYAVVYATVTILAVPARLGLPNYVVRETARAAVEENAPLMHKIWRWAFLLVVGTSAVVLAAAYGWTLLAGMEPGYAAAFLVGLCLVPMIAMTAVLGGALRGLGRVIAGLLPEFVIRHVFFSALLIGWVLLMGGMAASEALGLHLAGAGLALVFGAALLLRARPRWADTGRDADLSLRAMVLSTGTLGLIAGIQKINANLDVVMLGALTDAETAGIYKVASTAALLAVAGLQAINMVLMPRFARIYKEGNMDRLQRLATRGARMIIATAIPGALVLVLFGTWVLEIAFGAEYLPSYTPMVILVAGQLANAAFGSVVSLLNMTGHEHDTLRGVLIACGLNVVLNAALIPLYGADGAAIATATTLLAWNVLLFLKVRQRLGIVTTPIRI
ncbi:MAG: flippase [Pseudomonadota bacterium]